MATPDLMQRPKLTAETPFILSPKQFFGLVSVLMLLVVGPVVWGFTQTGQLRAEQAAAIASVRADMVTKADFVQMQSKIDALTGTINQLNVTLATMTARFEQQTRALEDLQAEVRAMQPAHGRAP
jgi:uncharacterized protein HemX